MKRRIISGLIVAVGMSSLAWLKMNSQVVSNFFYESSVLTFLYGLINIPVIIAVALTGIRSDGLILVLVFVWGAVFGYFVDWISEWMLDRSRKKSATERK